jgi:hypothetical protein
MKSKRQCVIAALPGCTAAFADPAPPLPRCFRIEHYTRGRSKKIQGRRVFLAPVGMAYFYIALAGAKATHLWTRRRAGCGSIA